MEISLTVYCNKKDLYLFIFLKNLVPDEDSFEPKITKKTVTFENKTKEFANDICCVCPVYLYFMYRFEPFPSVFDEYNVFIMIYVSFHFSILS